MTFLVFPNHRDVQRGDLRGAILLAPHLSDLLLMSHLKSLAPYLVLRSPKLGIFKETKKEAQIGFSNLIPSVQPS